MKKTLAVLAVLVALPLVARAQKPVTQTEAIELTTKIEAIDKTARLITLKDPDGETETIYCGPEVKRFDELKVGDTVTFRYYESTAYAIRKPGQPSGLPAQTGPTVSRGTGARPERDHRGAADRDGDDQGDRRGKVPSVTVLTEDGRTVSFKVEDKNNLKDVKVGDKVEITYTVAVMISVK